MRKGYFGGLMRMTGITIGQDNMPVSSPGIDTASLQPIHVEETIFVPSPPSQARLAPQNQETPNTGKPMPGTSPGKTQPWKGIYRYRPLVTIPLPAGGRSHPDPNRWRSGRR